MTSVASRYAETTESRILKLKSYLIKEYLPVVPEGLHNALLNEPRALELFNTAFTHMTYSPQNYETLETVGDAMLKAALIEYFLQSLPFINSPQVLSDLIAYYASKDYLNMLARKRGMQDLILVARDIQAITIDIREDVFEANIGALSQFGNIFGPKVYGFPMGAILVKNYVTSVYNNEKITPDSLKQSGVSTLTTRISKLRFGKLHTARVTIPDQPRRYYYFIEKKYLSPQALQQLGPERARALEEVFNRGLAPGLEKASSYALIGAGTSADMRDATEMAARDALIYLDKVGYNEKAAEQAKLQRDYIIPGFQEAVEPIIRRFGEYDITSKPVANFQVLYILTVPVNGVDSELAHIIISRTAPYDEVRVQLLKRGSEVLKRQLEPVAPTTLA